MTTDIQLDPLFVFDKDEWRDVVYRANPTITEEEFEKMWDEFVAIKRRKALN